jgi:hypothetical protein
MGFGSARATQRPSMLVGFIGDAADLDAAVKAGADFALVESGPAPDAKDLRGKAGDLPLLVSSKLTGRDAADALHEAGVDAALVSDDTPASALLIEDLGYVLTLPAAAEELYLRSLDSLNLEAVLLRTLPAPLTVAAQIQLNLIAGLARKPLLCLLDAVLDKDDLQSLRAAGAVGLLTSAANVAGLKEAVAALPPRRQRRDDRPMVSLPRGQAPAEHDDDDDDE